MKKGQYAEIITEYSEHIFRENVSKTERNYKFRSQEGCIREVDVCTTLTSKEQMAFEVRDRKSTQGIEWIDQVIGKYAGSQFTQIWLCTFDGCTLSSEAIKKLHQFNIGWRDFTAVPNVLNDYSKPVFMQEAIVPRMNECTLLVNGEIYKDVNYYCLDADGKESTISYIDTVLEHFISAASQNYQSFRDICEVRYTDKVPLERILTNFTGKYAEVELVIPLYRKIYMDFFDEAYSVVNNETSSIMVASKERVIFYTDEELVINFSYWGNRKDAVALCPSFLINLGMIQEKFKPIRQVKFVDVNGTANIVPMKMYGIRHTQEPSY